MGCLMGCLKCQSFEMEVFVIFELCGLHVAGHFQVYYCLDLGIRATSTGIGLPGCQIFRLTPEFACPRCEVQIWSNRISRPAWEFYFQAGQTRQLGNGLPQAPFPGSIGLNQQLSLIPL